jgi:hypothetical protein
MDAVPACARGMKQLGIFQSTFFKNQQSIFASRKEKVQNVYGINNNQYLRKYTRGGIENYKMSMNFNFLMIQQILRVGAKPQKRQSVIVVVASDWIKDPTSIRILQSSNHQKCPRPADHSNSLPNPHRWNVPRNCNGHFDDEYCDDEYSTFDGR